MTRAAGRSGHRGRRADHRRAPVDRRRMAHGGRGRDHRDVQLLPVEEPRWLRRRRHDGDAGRGARRAAQAAPHARRREEYFHDEVGFNSRLDALQAAVLSRQAAAPRRRGAPSAARTPRTTTRRSRISPACARRSSIRPTSRSSTSTRSAPSAATQLQSFLKERGIGTAIYYPLPLHLQPCFAYLGYKQGACPESERAANEVLSLPIYPELTRAQLDEVIAPCGHSMAAESIHERSTARSASRTGAPSSA